ncbi:unnamed protein product [Cylicocyclus nassatus]|uniref:Uncharacterized protein n=1 Tax=Cylicocyclus nassatus TaxID=53992 RepID=A0AA36DMR4_CYLNA|nr:unnamed protein product [Cylicocyclus nassatus]
MLPSGSDALRLLAFLVIAVSVANCLQRQARNSDGQVGRLYIGDLPYELVNQDLFGTPPADKHTVKRSDNRDILFDDSLPSLSNRFEWRFNRL